MLPPPYKVRFCAPSRSLQRVRTSSVSQTLGSVEFWGPCNVRVVVVYVTPLPSLQVASRLHSHVLRWSHQVPLILREQKDLRHLCMVSRCPRFSQAYNALHGSHK
ncbi:hypothetical protein TNCV_4593701 [Trichonephila clavipes]|uniref:Uncharacterized protein n=1 Tax=Trichonephila clavipes TaxID=2585209 RepID=A0A8X6WEX1_TRICX|nr:hypothetical protein TNCV_4593701 [Trichonephila clavipes]